MRALHTTCAGFTRFHFFHFSDESKGGTVLTDIPQVARPAGKVIPTALVVDRFGPLSGSD